MFGADTPLVMDALQMVVVAAAIGAGAVYLALRRKKGLKTPAAKEKTVAGSNLEERVQVLERIATDRSVDLADEIEALRDDRIAQETRA